MCGPVSHSVTDLTAASSRRFLTDFLQEYPTPGTGPYFDTAVPTNYTGLVEKPVLLVCRVRNLGNRTVSVPTWRTKKPLEAIAFEMPSLSELA